MKAINKVEGIVAPLDRPNIDTDQIMPKQFLKRIERTGFGPFTFYDWRKEPDFILNRPEYQNAKILATGPNFGCGSSREHAPWGLQDMGFDVIIAPSFADIFRNNCTKIGLLCVELPEDQVREIIKLALDNPGITGKVDMEAQTVEVGTLRANFNIDPFVKHRLLNGLDDIGLTLQHVADIDAYEARRPEFKPVTILS
ncbi:3-isopropylmalate dehydratase, small subunit [Thermobaculum terrenum ATCC BAA-798]|uniref:3-isopropylmalate dehydratase small subunit n=1 Tax=Thermobaculum terrenum (strain ATCC BAA-798 / CCMEE 7001 / YNP1) TaxID=525904 RepID=D1CDW1_THET1|nr:3-isopropylmalate dehydratase small subunit [Thermobaculum terrenum]ACZ41117.1 3-isopropylmalate dehydratase, small subunit [Thermobaculum terrenum ATCC BAA-798]